MYTTHKYYLNNERQPIGIKRNIFKTFFLAINKNKYEDFLFQYHDYFSTCIQCSIIIKTNKPYNNIDREWLYFTHEDATLIKASGKVTFDEQVVL